MSEQDLVNQIIDYLTRINAVATRINSGKIIITGKDGHRRAFNGAPKGTSDILACIHGRYVAIECKLEGETTTPEQVEFLAKVGRAGGIAIVAYSLDDVINSLANIF